MSVACGAGSGFGATTPTLAAPAKPYAFASRLSTDGITAAPAATPTMSAICWRIGDAPTSCPVLRSCRLSFEIVAHANTIAVTKSENATSAWRVSSVGDTASAISAAQMTIERIPTPESGLLDAPMSPAMYPETPAMTNPITSTNGTAINVSVNALGASTDDPANVNASHAEITRHARVRMP